MSDDPISPELPAAVETVTDVEASPRSIRPILIASLLALAALWFLGSVVSATDLGHAIGHLLPGGLEGCGGG